MTPESASERLLAVARKAPVIPVLVIGDASRAKGLAEALVAGGIYALEVTLRTADALKPSPRWPPRVSLSRSALPSALAWPC